jgi:Protein kinase domain
MVDGDLTNTPVATDAPDSGDARVPGCLPQKIGRFLVLRQLGQGGMGVVYGVYDEKLDRRVALKLLHPGAGGPERQHRMMREAQAMARVSHQSVVQVFDVGTVSMPRGEHIFITMEYIDGPTLARWREGERPWQEVVRIYCQAGEGLLAAHRAGLVHRDFKPDNVLLDPEGWPRIADFGLARRHDAVPKEGAATTSTGALAGSLTQAGAISGTPWYMSPEQFCGGSVDGRSDQFSFCVALHEALFGELPFHGRTVGERSTSVIEGRLLSPPAGTPVPLGVRQALQRGLATDPSARFASMRELLDALAVGARQETPAARAARRRANLGMGLGVVVLASFIVPSLVRRTLSVGQMVTIAVAGNVVFRIVMFLQRRSLREHPLHRRVATMVGLALAAALGIRLIALLVRAQIEMYVPIDLMMMAGFWVLWTYPVLPQASPVGIVPALAAVLGARFPQHVPRILAPVFPILALSLVYFWARAARHEVDL